MSLFDVIKYGNTDLNSAEEIFKLPRKISDVYWEISFLAVHGNIVNGTYVDRFWSLSVWYGIWPDAQKERFKEALEKYDEPV